MEVVNKRPHSIRQACLSQLLHFEAHFERPLGTKEKGEVFAPLLFHASLGHLVEPAAKVGHQVAQSLPRNGVEDSFDSIEYFLVSLLPTSAFVPVGRGIGESKDEVTVLDVGQHT